MRIIILLLCISFFHARSTYAQQLLEESVVIPNALKIAPDRLRQLPVMERQYLLSELKEAERYEIFQAPPCMIGNFYVAVQLMYDLSDRNTQLQWKTDLELSLLYGGQSQWTKSLSVNMEEQMILSTIFHDAPISCDKNYELQVERKVVTGAPEDNVYVRVLLFKVNDEPFDFSIPLELDVISSEDENRIVWSYNGPSVYEYDLEWVFVDQYARVDQTDKEIFKSVQPVRTATANTFFNHPILYPAGKIYYRVRPVTMEEGGNRITGDWFYSKSVDVENPTEHYSYKVNTQFTQDGSFQKTVVYHDADQNERQRIILNSDDNFGLASEHLYDFEGRQAIEILPAPLSIRTLRFQEALNRFQPTDPLVNIHSRGSRDKFHFDNGKLENSFLSSESGASRYYSPLNENEALVADGEGYVYRQTTYLNDALKDGISVQAGKDLRADGSHASKNYYATAGREELIRLLGYSALGQNFTKQLSIDVNGQMKVVYLNAQEKPVIEWLEGEELSTAEPIQVNLLQHNGADFVLLNSKPGTVYDFSYTADSNELVDFALNITTPSGEAMTLNLPGDESGDLKEFNKYGITASELSGLKFQLSFDELGGYTISRRITPVSISPEEVLQQIKSNEDFEEICSKQSYDSLACASCNPLADDKQLVYYKDLSSRSIRVELENLYDGMVQDYHAKHQGFDADTIVEDSLRNHPLYDSYMFKKNNIESESFDRLLTKIQSWTEAERYGFTDPLSIDPFFNDESKSQDLLKSAMQEQLSNILLASLIHEEDTIELKGSVFEVVDPANTSFYINTYGQPDKVGGIHPLYIDLLMHRNKMSQEAFRAAVNEKHWNLFCTYYLNAKRFLVFEKSEFQHDEFSHDDLYDSLDTDLYSSNSLDVMEWAFNKKFSVEDRATIKDLLTSYFGSASDNFLHIILKSDLPSNKYLIDIQSILNKYGCDLTYIAQEDKLACWTDDLFERSETREEIVEAPEDSTADVGNAKKSPANKRIGNTSIENTSQDQSVKKNWVGYKMKSAVTPKDEYKALMILYDKLGGSGWKNNTGWSQASSENKSVSGWYGIITNAQGRVVAIKLPDNNLRGTLPEELGTFTELQYLDLGSLSKDGNKITGPLPGSLGNLTKLAYLDLENNEVTGSFPSQLYRLTNLRTLNLSGNKFTGSLSSEIGKLTSLTSLIISRNKLNNSIPTEIGSLSQLKQLDISHNEITNSIPASIGNLSQLIKLDLSYNRLKGNIPSTFGSLKNIQYVRLNNNQLQYDIPESINSLSSLLQLDLSFNKLSGHIPAFSKLSKLQHVMIGNNQLSGLVPATFGSLPEIKSLNLSKNLLSGAIPSELLISNSLEYLDLSANQLTGEIPSGISVSSKLQFLSVSENQLTGNLPASFRDSKSLRQLIIHHNEFTGSLESIATIKSLTVLQAGHNKIEGKIPGSLGDLANLEVLLLESNQLSDTIPQNLGNAGKLKRIDLSQNNLVGSIPFSLGMLTDLEELTLSDNKLTGTIPSSLGGIARLVVTNNRLKGKVPVFLTERQNTGEAFWLSYNNYTFSDILSLKDQLDVESFLFHRQDSVDEKKVVPLFIDQPFELIAQIDRGVSPACEYQWFKYVDGIDDEPLNQPSVNSHTITKETVTTSHSGSQYYFKITNPSMPGITLVSNIQTIMALPGNSLCVRFNPLKTFTIVTGKEANANSWHELLMKERLALSNHDLQHHRNEKVLDVLSTNRSVKETFNVRYTPDEGNYTVNYFDVAGNLSRSFTNHQVQPLSIEEVEKVMVGEKISPEHSKGTRYEYNSGNQIVAKEEATGKTWYGYNQQGLLRWTQNGHQREHHLYTYFRYDAQHRVIESGEMKSKIVSDDIQGLFENPLYPDGKKEDLINVTTTSYDLNEESNRLERGYVIRKEWRAKGKDSPLVTSYTYDENGYVSALEHHEEGEEDKTIAYQHDPITGKLLYQFYQVGAKDQFIQHFSYNAAGNLIQVGSSTDGFIWNKEAKYAYYDHGPLKQVILGEYDVQTADYYYTIQGWLKGVNSIKKSDKQDQAQDEYSYTLGYYNNDFIPVSGELEKSNVFATELFNGEASWSSHHAESHTDSTIISASVPHRIIYNYDGNVVATYKDGELNTNSICGLTQLGSCIGHIAQGTRRLGARHFVLPDHKGQVLSVISDKVSLQGRRSKPTVVKDGYEHQALQVYGYQRVSKQSDDVDSRLNDEKQLLIK